MDEREILTVRDALDFCKLRTNVTASQVITARGDSDTSVARFALQCHHRKEPKGGTGLGCRGRKKTIVSLLSGHAWYAWNKYPPDVGIEHTRAAHSGWLLLETDCRHSLRWWKAGSTWSMSCSHLNTAHGNDDWHVIDLARNFLHESHRPKKGLSTSGLSGNKPMMCNRAGLWLSCTTVRMMTARGRESMMHHDSLALRRRCALWRLCGCKQME